MLKAIYSLIVSLPDILKLLKMLDDAMKENEIKGKVKNAVKEINEALASGDTEKLNNVFANRGPK